MSEALLFNLVPGESMAAVQDRLVSLFADCPDWDARYEKLIRLGRELPPMPEAYRTDGNKIKGCQSQVWLFPDMVQGKVHFHADSDALIVKGIVALLICAHQDRTPAEILATPFTLLDRLELSRYLTPTRANGLAAMLKQMRLYAFALQARA